MGWVAMPHRDIGPIEAAVIERAARVINDHPTHWESTFATVGFGVDNTLYCRDCGPVQDMSEPLHHARMLSEAGLLDSEGIDEEL